MAMNFLNISFLFLLFFNQVWFFNKNVGYFVLFLGFLFYFIAVIKNEIKLNISKDELFLTFMSFSYFLLCLILFFVGEFGENSRFLVIYSLIQFVLFSCVINAKNKNLNFINKSLIVFFLIEALIVLLQFLYISYGWGIKSDSEYGIYSFSGSQSNPNNTAVILCIIFIYFSLNDFYQKRESSIYIIILSLLLVLCVWFTLSRTVLLFSSIYILYYFYINKKKIFFILPILIFGFVFFLTQLNKTDNIYLDRSITKASSITSFHEDSSANFRVQSYISLYENVGDLGLGTLSDRNYSHFFHKSNFDTKLIAVNPHGYIPEMSFLFGYFGLFYAVLFIFFFIYMIIKNQKINLFLKLFFLIMLILYLSVPSSILSMPIFFLIFYLISKLGKI